VCHLAWQPTPSSPNAPGVAFTTPLDSQLKARGVTQVLIGGVATRMGVESTARAAPEHGYHVVLVTDTMLDPDQGSHDHSVSHVFPKLGEITTTQEVLIALSA